MERSEGVEPVVVVSDGTGETAQRVLSAALRQFSDRDLQPELFPLVKTVAQLEAVFKHAARQGALVVSTLVQDGMRRDATRLAREHHVRHHDVLGPLLSELEAFLERRPVEVPGLLHRADARYYRRIEAIEFTVRADDGKDGSMLVGADIVLVGVSRTGKTPLSTFLAHKGFKVGNQPLVMERPVPEALYRCDPRRVFALTLDPGALQVIRRARLREMGMSDNSPYCDMGYILAELDVAERLFRAQRWPVLDVTHKAVEETAASIVRLLQEQGLAGPEGEVSQLA